MYGAYSEGLPGKIMDAVESGMVKLHAVWPWIRVAALSQRGWANVISLALALLDHLQELPPSCLPRPSAGG